MDSNRLPPLPYRPASVLRFRYDQPPTSQHQAWVAGGASVVEDCALAPRAAQPGQPQAAQPGQASQTAQSGDSIDAAPRQWNHAEAKKIELADLLKQRDEIEKLPTRRGPAKVKPWAFLICGKMKKTMWLAQ